MIISEDKKFIFVHNQKTAGVSIKNYLFENVSDAEYLLPNHAYTTDAIQKIGRDKWNQYYSFGFVRNPWARLVSWYSMIINGAESEGQHEKHQWSPNNELWKYVKENSSDFKEFIKNCTETITEEKGGIPYKKSFVKNQIDYFTDDNGEVAVNFIGKVENLEEDFNKVIEHLELPATKLIPTNKTKKKDYREYYDEETRQIVAERFKKDIDYFGYEF